MTGPGMLGHINAMNRGGATGPTGPLPQGATGANGPSGYVGVNAAASRANAYYWERTPWWVFWRPKWCRRRTSWQRYQSNAGRVRGEYEYATDRQRARQILQETFDR